MNDQKLGPQSIRGKNVVRVLVLGMSLLAFNVWSAVALTVVPSGNAAVEGNGNNVIPFGTDSFCADGIRYQQLYTGSQVGGPKIGSMSFRLGSGENDVGPVNYTGVTITLSSTLATQGTMSMTFADNVGPNAAIVFSGDLVTDPSVSEVAPNPFDFTINFDTPFEFDGSVANLLVDITIEGCNSGTTFSLDAESGNTAVTRIYAEDKDDAVAKGNEGPDHYGLVTQFFIFTDGVVFLPYSVGSGGNWAIDGHNGEGFLFEPLAGGTIVIFWFTYDLFGDQMWMLGVASPGSFTTDPETGEDVATVEMYRTSGPFFGPGYDPGDYMETLMGTVTFRLKGCLAAEGATAEVDYNLNFGFGFGTYDLTKLYDILGNTCKS